jgi:MinD-like ATPase involved in chromosome partitioning or flagellar assembly
MLLRVVTVAGDATGEAELARALSLRDDVDLLFRCVDRVELLASLRSDPIDALVSVGLPTWLDREITDEARGRGIASLGIATNDMDRMLMERLGITLVEATPSAIVARALDPGEGPIAPLRMPVGAKRGRLVAVWGSKGSPGRTTIAVELAAQLALQDDATLLIDADAYGGDVAQMLGVTEDLPTILWAAKLAAKDELDAGRFAIDLRRAGKTGPVLMPGLTRSELWPDVSSHAWRRVLETATSEFSFVVADVGFCVEPATDLYAGDDGRNRMARSTLECADRVVAVFRADPIGIKNFLRAMDQLLELVSRERLLVVANRVRHKEQGQVADLIRTNLGIRPVAYLPDRPAQHYRAILSGESLTRSAPGCDAAAAVRAVATAVGSAPRPSGFLSRLVSR